MVFKDRRQMVHRAVGGGVVVMRGVIARLLAVLFLMPQIGRAHV